MKLYIIGNGFDIAYGIPSKYSDFMNFVWKKDEQLGEFLDNYFPGKNLWEDFENTLGNVNYR